MIKDIFKKLADNKKSLKILKQYKISKRYFLLTKQSIANAFFMGLFWAMMPMPFQMLAVIICTPLLTFNLPLSLTLVWVSNPVTMPFILYAQYHLGNFILNRDLTGDVTLTLQWFQNNFNNILEPLLLGALISALVLASVARVTIVFIWEFTLKKS